jgi:hypothetical protein
VRARGLYAVIVDQVLKEQTRRQTRRHEGVGQPEVAYGIEGETMQVNRLRVANLVVMTMCYIG